MQGKTNGIGRRAFLSLAVLVTLAPVGVGVQHLLRLAATIDDLGLAPRNTYPGGLWSNRDLEIQNESVTLSVLTKVRSRFTGTFSFQEELGGLEIPVTGGVSRTGRMVLSGSVNQPPLRLRVNVTAQLSAGGSDIIGTYTLTGQDEGGRINDRGSIALSGRSR